MGLTGLALLGGCDPLPSVEIHWDCSCPYIFGDEMFWCFGLSPWSVRVTVHVPFDDVPHFALAENGTAWTDPDS
jgi:hypothetical protein